jgi:hypothetical protein
VTRCPEWHARRYAEAALQLIEKDPWGFDMVFSDAVSL